MATNQKLIRIGASSVADLCGEGFNSIQKLWRIKTKREERAPADAYMQHGVDNEWRAVQATECDLGVIWSHTGDRDTDQKRIARKVDGAELVMYLDGLDCSSWDALECKCPQRLKDEVPLKYMIQIQTGFMLEPRIQRFLYAEWTPAETRKWWVYPEVSWQRVILENVKRFLGFIREDREPPRWSSKANPKPVFPSVRTERT